MVWSLKKINLSDIFFSGLPGIISIFLTFFSIPIFLKYLGTHEYSSYIMSHIFLSLSLLFNLNIGKITSIKIQKLNIKKKSIIISNAIYISILIALLTSSISIFLIREIFYDKGNFNFYLIFFGLFISIIYVNLEYINKGLRNFKISAICNLVFLGGSIALPSFIILISPNKVYIENIFTFSIILKLLTFLFLIYYITKKIGFNFKNINTKHFQQFKNQSVWMTLSNTYNQLFDYLDKYLIKIFLPPIIFINYSIAQQIASKITIISQAIISVLLPNLSKSNQGKQKEILSLYFYLFYLPCLLFLLIGYDFFDNILVWWLKKNFNIQFLNFFYLFLLLTFIACCSHILISFFEANFKAKQNTIYESYSIFPFIILLIFLIYKQNIFGAIILILSKEIILFFFRLNHIKTQILSPKLLILSTIFLTAYWITKILNMHLENFIVMVFLILTIIIQSLNVFKKIKKK